MKYFTHVRENTIANIFTLPMTLTMVYSSLLDEEQITMEQMLKSLVDVYNQEKYFEATWNEELNRLELLRFRQSKHSPVLVKIVTWEMKGDELCMVYWRTTGDDHFAERTSEVTYDTRTWIKTHHEEFIEPRLHVITNKDKQYSEEIDGHSINLYCCESFPEMGTVERTHIALIREEGIHNYCVEKHPFGYKIYGGDERVVYTRDRDDKIEAISQPDFTIVCEYNEYKLVNLISCINTKPSDKVKRIRVNTVNYAWDDETQKVSGFVLTYDTAKGNPEVRVCEFK
ncbi:hypothetical protein SM033_00175 [Vibrio phage vB_VpaM_sm033]|nr:hypothetical protein SM033_00175 [Vibrio phage vB_VpaM_sm033]